MDLFDAFDELTVMRTMAGQTVERGSLDGSLALLTSYDVSLVHHPPAEVMREVPPISSHNADVVRQYLDALPKRLSASQEPAEPEVSVKVTTATLSAADREVMQKLGLTQDDFVQTRVTQENRKRTGQGRGAH